MGCWFGLWFDCLGLLGDGGSYVFVLVVYAIVRLIFGLLFGLSLCWCCLRLWVGGWDVPGCCICRLLFWCYLGVWICCLLGLLRCV